MTAKSQGVDLAAPQNNDAIGDNKVLTVDELINFRAAQLAGKQEDTATQVVEETAPDESSNEDQVVENDQEPLDAEAEDDRIADGENGDEVLSKFKLEELSEDELESLGKAIRSKIPRRFGELTKRAKSAEERIDELTAEIRNLKTSGEDKLKSNDVVENNPFSTVNSVEELGEKAKQAREVMEWAEQILDDNEDKFPDDIVYKENGKDYTKRDIKKYMRNARSSLDKFLPARLSELKKVEEIKQVDSALTSRASTEFSWLNDSDSNLANEYKMLVESEQMKRVVKAVPDIAPQLKYILAHFVDSYSSKTNKKQSKPAVQIQPPSHTKDIAAKRGSERDGVSKEISLLTAKLASTGSPDDFAAIRAKQSFSNK